MSLAILSAACAFVLSVLFTPLFRKFALLLGWVDQPDHKRKMHSVPVPRIGGVPIALASAGGIGVLLLIGRHGGSPIDHLPIFWKLLPAAALVFLTGLFDDLIGTRPWQKLLGQVLAAGLACWAGVRIDSIAHYDIGAGLGVPLTILWLVGCTNAFNLIDGSDGVATGVGLFATLTTGVAALLHGDTGLMLATAPLAGALAGFLCFNFNPASIFLGDCGSLWVGFMLGCYAVIWSQKPATLLGMAAPVLALSIPLLDTTLSIVRRFLRGTPIFSPDHSHIHHRLLERGLTPRRVALLLYGASVLAACFSLLQSTLHGGVGGIVIVLFCAAAGLGIQYLGYQEFRVAIRQLLHHGFRTRVHSALLLDGYDKSLRAARNADECWWALRTASKELGFCNVALRLAGHSYQEHLEKAVNGHWALRIPLSDSDYVLLMRQVETSAGPATIVPFANLVYRALVGKAVQFRRQTAA